MSHQSRRLETLQRHLNGGTIERNDTYATSDTTTDELYRFLVRDNAELRQQIFEFLKDPLYRPNYYLSLAEFRELTTQRVIKFLQQGMFSISDYINNPLKFQAALESLSFCDYSMAIKCGVHATLCGGTIAKLGTEHHHREYLPKMDALKYLGCFGMTELGHGSNVLGIETTAVFDRGEFIINTPSNEASKYWIGGAANTANICTVFAQLTINGKWEGPHVFIVRLRDDAGNVMPGVRIADHGPKQGLNGVDNGQIWFNNVRVPRENMLDKISKVDPSGNYSSAIANPAQRFGVMISGLTTGRLLIAQAAVDACKSGLTIAIRYGLTRPQFGSVVIMSYTTHQRRLYPALATTYAMHLSMNQLKQLALSGNSNPETAKQVHVLSSGLKAASTWHRVRILQDCRESCGGLGFLAANKIGPMLNDMNVDVTFEGDNTVMMQQVAKAELEAAKKGRPSLALPSVDTNNLGLGCCSLLLNWRSKTLAAETLAEMSRCTNPSEAFDTNLDLVVKLGWAAVDAHSYDVFMAEARAAPASIKPMMEMLCLLYGLSRIENGLETYLISGNGVVNPSVVRKQIAEVCGRLNADNGRIALQLVDGFKIPDHLIQAPIATGSGWRTL